MRIVCLENMKLLLVSKLMPSFEISILPKAIKAIGLLVVGCWVRAIVIGCISCEDE